MSSVFVLKDLPYSYDALAPYMSAETLEYHHDKHHQAYVTNGANLCQEIPSLAEADLETIVKKSWQDQQVGLFNNASQHWNHNHFWHWLRPQGGGKIPGNLEKKIMEDFSSVNAFEEAFQKAGATQFGSGWCWLVLNDSGKLEVTKTANGENPLVHGGLALLGCDVWEHSYYIDYRNARPKYLEAFLKHLVNWEYVTELFEKAR